MSSTDTDYSDDDPLGPIDQQLSKLAAELDRVAGEASAMKAQVAASRDDPRSTAEVVEDFERTLARLEAAKGRALDDLVRLRIALEGIKAIRARGVKDFSCPRCSHASWGADTIRLVIAPAPAPTERPEQPTVLALVLTCQVCAFMELHSLKALGVKP